MRRHLLLIGLMALILVAIALMRPNRRETVRPVQIAATAQPFGLDPSEFISQRGVEAPEPPALPITATIDAKPIRLTRNVQVRIPGGRDATVVLMRSKDNFETHDSAELRPDQEGFIGFDMLREGEWTLVYAHRPGGGSGWVRWGPHSPDNSQDLKLIPDLVLKIRCVGKDGAPRRDVNLMVNAEMELSRSYDSLGNHLGSRFVRLPVQRKVTDSAGRCQFEGFRKVGLESGQDGPRIPTFRFTITASRVGATSELKLDSLPEREVEVVLD